MGAALLFLLSLCILFAVVALGMFRLIEKCNSDIAEMIALLLQDDRDGWTITNHHANHETLKISLWIANEDYGFGVRLDGRDAGPYDMALARRDRKCLWKAFTCRRDGLIAENSEQAAQDLAERIVAHFQKVAA